MHSNFYVYKSYYVRPTKKNHIRGVTHITDINGISSPLIFHYNIVLFTFCKKYIINDFFFLFSKKTNLAVENIRVDK